jgi:hypothetical protein
MIIHRPGSLCGSGTAVRYMDSRHKGLLSLVRCQSSGS